MRPPIFAGFHDAYVAVLEEVLSRYEFVNAPRGNRSLECLDVSFRLNDPQQRLPYLPGRKINVVFHLAETLWYLSGRRDLAMPGHYAPRMAAYSVDGQTLGGTAYGPNLRRQWDRVIELLRRDPDTKRAVITFFDPDELVAPDNPDVSCTVAAQFLQRDGALHLSVFMRGNDAYRGMVGDVFAFTFIQEFTAAQLSVRLGTYTHHVASMHVNAADVTPARRAIDSDTLGNRSDEQRQALAMASMPADASWGDIHAVGEHEEALRVGDRTHTFETITASGLAPYWQQLVLVFEAYRQIKNEHQRPVNAELLARLDPAIAWHITRRWPDRVPSDPA